MVGGRIDTGSTGSASGGDIGSGVSGEGVRVARPGAAGARQALQRLAGAQGLEGEVVAAMPHRNSLPSVLSVEGLQQREDPSAWMAASDTKSEAAFVGAAGRRPEDKALSADYLRRRLGAAAKAPAWLKAVADDVPSTTRWWK